MWIESANGEMYNLNHIHKIFVVGNGGSWRIEAELSFRIPPGASSSTAFPVVTLKHFGSEEKARHALHTLMSHVGVAYSFNWK